MHLALVLACQLAQTPDRDEPCEATDWYADADDDGFGGGSPVQSCDAPEDHVADNTDCDDGHPWVNPEAAESCNERDDDCDGAVDEEDADGNGRFHLDADGDGFGDSDDQVQPSADESCNAIDDDCDGEVDEDDALDAPSWYEDLDQDGYGGASSRASCEQPSGYSSSSGDCDDFDDDVWPGTDELCNGHDDDCDGSTDEDAAVDAAEFFTDADADGYGDASTGSVSCYAGSGETADDTDCDDTDADVNPGEAEICENGVDDD
ncbi:MAG: hypothetical protein GY913_32485 [Proteobacteria bacterium]|nr:hypothetical protein [Pseudomonadota bacterium]